MSFTALRDAAPFPPGAAARRFFIERLGELSKAAQELKPSDDPRLAMSARLFSALSARAAQRFDLSAPPAMAAGATPAAKAPTPERAPGANEPTMVKDGVEIVEGRAMTLTFEARRCIHARFCVTGAPTVFLANVQGPWLHPDTLDAAERLAAALAQECIRPGRSSIGAKTDGRMRRRRLR